MSWCLELPRADHAPPSTDCLLWLLLGMYGIASGSAYSLLWPEGKLLVGQSGSGKQSMLESVYETMNVHMSALERVHATNS